jgi:hypothetical protein
MENTFKILSEFSETVYNNTADIGKAQSKMTFINGLIIGIILIIISLYLYFYKKSDYKQIKAHILSVNECPKRLTNDLYDCSITISYNINNKSYENIVTKSYDFDDVSMIRTSSYIDIYYNIHDPTNVSLKDMSTTILSKIIPSILLCISLIIILISYFQNKLTNQYKPFAAFNALNKIFKFL